LLCRRPRGSMKPCSRHAVEGCRTKMVLNLCNNLCFIFFSCKNILVRAGFK
jgi:hypothetical protein